MKKRLFFKATLVLAFTLASSAVTLAQNVETSKSIDKSAQVSTDIRIDISNQSGDLKINTTSENEVSMHTQVKAIGKTKEDVDKLIAAIESFEFKHNNNLLKIDTRFYKSMQSNNNKTTITLLNGEKVRIKDFQIKHELNIPKSASLKLDNKYSTVYLDAINGETQLNLYSSKLRANDFNSPVNVNSKYSKIQLENFNDKAVLELYDTDIHFKSSKDLKINSKYSKVIAQQTDMLVIESFDDKFYIDNLKDIKLNAKYSDLKSEAQTNSAKLDLYDSNIQLASAKTVIFNGKYCELKLGNVGIFRSNESFDNDVFLQKSESVNLGNSKYSKYIMASNSSFLSENCFDDNIEIQQLNQDFSGIKVSGKYGKLNINAGSVELKVDAKMKYGSVSLPEKITPSKHIDKNGEIEILAGGAGPSIEIRGFDMKVIIK